MIGSDILIHIGYHKTGTTFLQNKVFPVLPANLLIMPNVDYLATSKKYDPDIFIQTLSNQIHNKPHQLTILSQEVLSGRGDGNPIWDPHLIANRLITTFPKSKILIVIRNQFDYILSLYAFRVLRRGLEHRTLDQFLDAKWQWLVNKLQYDRLIGDYIRLVGHDRVLVLPYEMLAQDGTRFVSATLDFIGCKAEEEIAFNRVNSSTRNGRLLQTNRIFNAPFNTALELGQQNDWINQSQFSRFANGYFYFKRKVFNRILEPFINNHESEITFSKRWTNKMAPIFKASNRRSMDLAGIDLHQWAYPI